MLAQLFGVKYFGFIAASYAVTFAVLLIMLIWVIATHGRRKSALAALEKAGLKRGQSAAQGDNND